MGKFVTVLVAEKRDINWALHEPLIFVSDILGTILVPEGYSTDFASVPRLPFIYALFGDTAHASSVIHDNLVDDEMIPWKIAADVFMEAMEAEDADEPNQKRVAKLLRKARRYAMYWGVRLAGIGR